MNLTLPQSIFLSNGNTIFLLLGLIFFEVINSVLDRTEPSLQYQGMTAADSATFNFPEGRWQTVWFIWVRTEFKASVNLTGRSCDVSWRTTSVAIPWHLPMPGTSAVTEQTCSASALLLVTEVKIDSFKAFLPAVNSAVAKRALSNSWHVLAPSILSKQSL